MKLLNKNIPISSYHLLFTFLVIILCLLSCTIITLTHAFSHQTTNDLITTICHQTPDPSLCESSLRSDPRSSTATDNQGLILIMIDVVKTRFNETHGYLMELTRKTRDTDCLRALNLCMWLYSSVTSNRVNRGIRAVKQGDPKAGEQAMTDAGNDPPSCEKSFPEDSVPTGLVVRDKMLQQISNVAASMFKTIE